MRKDDLHFTDLTPAQQRAIRAIYAGKAENETISTIRVLVRRGWLERRTLVITARGIKAYEYWLAWGTSEKALASARRMHSTRGYLDKLKRAQMMALRTMGRQLR